MYKQKSVLIDSITFHMIFKISYELTKKFNLQNLFLICRIFSGKYLTIWEFRHDLRNIQQIGYPFPGMH